MTKRFLADREHVDLTNPSVDPATVEAEIVARVREVEAGEVELVPMSVAWRSIFGTELPTARRDPDAG